VEGSREDPLGGSEGETGRGKGRWKVRDLLADERRVRPMLDFLSTTDVGRLAPPLEEEDAVSAVSEMEVREFLEEREAGARRWALGGNFRCSYPHLTSWPRQERARGGCTSFFCPSSLFLCCFLGAPTSFRERPGRRAKGSMHRAATVRTADWNQTVYNLAMIYQGRMRVLLLWPLS